MLVLASFGRRLRCKNVGNGPDHNDTDSEHGGQCCHCCEREELRRQNRIGGSQTPKPARSPVIMRNQPVIASYVSTTPLCLSAWWYITRCFSLRPFAALALRVYHITAFISRLSTHSLNIFNIISSIQQDDQL